MPNLYIVAGPNGAGKTTYARRFLPEEMRCREFVNADMIAAGLSPFAPETVAFEAGRLMLRRLRDLTAQRVDFSFETTLTGQGYVGLLREMRKAGYRIRLDFLWVRDLDITRERVQSRVSKGGHDIPDEVQQRRFGKGLRLLFSQYRPLLDELRVFDNSGEDPHLIIWEKDGGLSVKDHVKLAEIEDAIIMSIMESKPDGRVEEPVSVPLDDVTHRAMRAMRKAYADVIFENLRYGLPVIQWREGRGVVKVPPEQLVPLAKRIMEVNGEPIPEAEMRELLRGVV